MVPNIIVENNWCTMNGEIIYLRTIMLTQQDNVMDKGKKYNNDALSDAATTDNDHKIKETIQKNKGDTHEDM